MKIKNKKAFILSLTFVFVVFSISSFFKVSLAVNDFVPITEGDAGNIWGEVQGGTGDVSDVGFTGLVVNLYRYTIVISAMLAVIVITIGGIQYMGGGSYTTKGAGRERMKNAVIGVIIIISAVLILNIINPNIAELSLFGGDIKVKTDTVQSTDIDCSGPFTCYEECEPGGKCKPGYEWSVSSCKCVDCSDTSTCSVECEPGGKCKPGHEWSHSLCKCTDCSVPNECVEKCAEGGKCETGYTWSYKSCKCIPSGIGGS